MPDYVERTIDAYNRVAEQYAKDHASELGPATDRLERFAELIAGKKVLEVGFGLLNDGKWFVDHDFDYSGVDPTAPYCQRAREILGNRARIIEGDIIRTALPLLRYDGIWAMASLLHFRKPELLTLFNKFHLTLDTNGILFAAMKNGSGFQVDSTGRGIQRYQPEQFVKIATSKGFKLEDLIPGKPNPTFPSTDDWTSYYLRKI